MSTAKTTRKQIPAKIDVTVIAGLKILAESSGLSANKYLEELLISHLKASGILPVEFQVPKSQWGGYRPKATPQAPASGSIE